MATIDFGTEITTIGGERTTLEAWKGKVLLVVNVASQCGLTPQYGGLQELWSELGDQGLVVLGFPCNQFGHQEPGTDAQIATFCETDWAVTFPLFSKIEVNGAGAHPLFQQLKAAAPGLLGTEMIKWNFTKFLVGRDGTVLARFAPTDTPASIRQAVINALAA
jgi:glutathione peroxidase